MGKTPIGDEGGADAWDTAALDDDFVNAAEIVERTAEERIEERLRVEEARRLFDEAAADEELAELQARRRRRRTVRRGGVGLLVVVSLFLGAVATRCSFDDDAIVLPILDDGGGASTWTATERPPPAPDQRATPIGSPPASRTTGPHRFVALQPDGTTPVAYDPCRPIHYVVNTDTAPLVETGVLDEAIAEISKATGLMFVYDGPTSEKPSATRAAYQPQRYEEFWAPVLIAWTDATTAPELAGDVAGSAGSVQVRVPGSTGSRTDASVFVTGSVHLDGPDLKQILREDDGTTRVRAIIQHELGHLVGLDHVDDQGELMYPTTGDRTELGPGDREGLARLGSGACFPTV